MATTAAERWGDNLDAGKPYVTLGKGSNKVPVFLGVFLFLC
jgi:hypothetical protein